MRLIVTGVGDAFSAKHFGSSGLLEVDGGLFAIDCPGHVLGMYRAASASSGREIDPARIMDIILTHLHGDHSNGLETIGFAHKHLYQSRERPRLHAIPEVLERVWEKLAPAMDGRGRGSNEDLETYFQPCPMTEDAPVRIGPLEVRCRRTKHAVPTAGLMISDGEVTLGWSSDCQFEQAHIDWLAPADLIVHECGEQAMHARWDELDTLPDAIKAKMRLIHIPDDISLPSGPMRPLAEGEVLELSNIRG